MQFNENNSIRKLSLNPNNVTRRFDVPLCISILPKTWIVTVYVLAHSTIPTIHCSIYNATKKQFHSLIGVNNISDCYTLFVFFFCFAPALSPRVALHSYHSALCLTEAGFNFIFCKETNIEVKWIFLFVLFILWCSVMIVLSVSWK